jgi:hypothetical protein
MSGRTAVATIEMGGTAVPAAVFCLGGTGNLPVAVGNLPTSPLVSSSSGKLPDNTGQWQQAGTFWELCF